MDADTVNLATVIATIVVAAAAVASLIMNGRSGHQAKRSAEAAERAAEAARDAAAATVAAVEVDFDVEFIFGFRFGVLGVVAKHASVWAHLVRLIGVYDATGFNVRDIECEILPPQSPPVYVHKGNTVLCSWPDQLPQGSFYGYFEVTYSYERDSATTTYSHMAKGEGPEARDGLGEHMGTD